MRKQTRKAKNAYNESEPTFAEMVESGKCSVDAIDDYITKWHTEYHGPLKIYEYLGLTREQYARWMVDSSSLGRVLRRKRKCSAVSARQIAAALLRVAEAVENPPKDDGK